MTQYDNTNRGSIWTNEKKATEKHPDFTGSLNVDGKEYWVSAWRGNGENPKAPKLTFSVNAKEPMAAKPAQQAADFNDSDVPF